MLLVKALLVLQVGLLHTSHGRITVTVSDELEKRVDAIEYELGNLTERIEDVEKLLDTQDVETGEGESSTTPAVTSVKDTDESGSSVSTTENFHVVPLSDQPPSPVAITDIRIYPFSPQLAHFRVFFANNSQDFVVKCAVSGFRIRDPDSLTQGADGVYETSIIIHDQDNQMNYDTIWFMFYDKDITNGVDVAIRRLKADPLNTQRVSGDELALPTLGVTPVESLIYQEGYDIDFILVVDKDVADGDAGRKTTFHNVQPFLYDLDTKKTVDEFPGDFIVSHPDPNSGKEPQSIYETHWATLKTSRHRVSGFIIVQAHTVHGDESLIDALSVVRIIEVKPNTQPFPFPREVLAFMNNNDGTDIETIECLEGGKYNACTGRCIAIGGNISEITVNRIFQNGSTVPIQPGEFLRKDNPFMRHAIFNVPIPQEGENKESQKIVCTAYSKDGSVTTKNLLIEFKFAPSFVLGNTDVRFIRAADKSFLELTCTVTGNPLPQVRLMVTDKAGFGIEQTDSYRTFLSPNGLEETVTDVVDVENVGQADCVYSRDDGAYDVYRLYETN